jgi:hypothetical protein
MSTYNAIHDLSETLRRLLADRLNRPGQTVTITVDSPHKEKAELPRVNLFLYQILPDPTRRNALRIPVGPPADNKQSFAREPLALNFRYLLTAFAEDGLSEHRLLGESMQVFHENQHIREDALYGTLSDSDIRAARVQLVMQSLDLESVNNIWGSNVALLRASVAYEASMAFIEPSGPRPAVPLVLHEPHPELVAIPYLESIHPIAAQPGAQVKLYGANLALPYLKIWLGDEIVAPLAGAKPRVAAFIVPPGLGSGRRKIHLQFDRFRSNAVELEVLPL